jgi:hypothetical protein
MDKRLNLDVKGYLSKISPVEKIYEELDKEKLVENVIGFLALSDSTDMPLHIVNVASEISAQGYSVCILDADVFYPRIYKLLNCVPQEKGNGMKRCLSSDKADLREEISRAKNINNLYVLGASPYDNMEEYFDTSEEDLVRVFLLAKEVFDYVFINIPNNPPLEFCYVAMRFCSIGFTFWSERIDAPENTEKFFTFMNSIGISTANFGNIIISNRLGLSFDIKVIFDMHLRFVTELPMIETLYQYALNGELYLREGRVVDRRYQEGIETIQEIILA